MKRILVSIMFLVGLVIVFNFFPSISKSAMSEVPTIENVTILTPVIKDSGIVEIKLEFKTNESGLKYIGINDIYWPYLIEASYETKQGEILTSGSIVLKLDTSEFLPGIRGLSIRHYINSMSIISNDELRMDYFTGIKLNFTLTDEVIYLFDFGIASNVPAKIRTNNLFNSEFVYSGPYPGYPYYYLNNKIVPVPYYEIEGKIKPTTKKPTPKSINKIKTGLPKVPKSKKVKKGTRVRIKSPKNTTYYYSTNRKTKLSKFKRLAPGKIKRFKIRRKTILRVYAIRKGYKRSNVVTRTYRVKR
jgi:hypothetical protein